MAQRTVVTVTDDLDGTEGAETATFGFGGVDYEIDLSPANAEGLAKILAPYMENGRRTAKAAPGRRAARGRTDGDRSRANDIREWARGHGMPVNDRGRIPASVLAAWQAAGSPAAAASSATAAPPAAAPAAKFRRGSRPATAPADIA
jgi:hypothetical protein